MSILKEIKTVLWSLIGLSPRQDRDAEAKPVNPLLLIVIAFVCVLVFVAALALIAHTVAKG